jgi:hypothetical protein
MKWLLILVILFGAVDAARSAEESLGSKIKKVLEPDPSRLRAANIENTRRRNRRLRHRQSFAKTKESFADSIPDAEEQIKTQKTSPTPTPGESPSATETPSATPAESPEAGRGKKAGLM